MKSLTYSSLYSLIAVFAFSCKNNEIAGPDRSKLVDWTNATHGKDADPNYNVVFPQNQVNTLEIRMTKNDWTTVRTDMKALIGSDFGAGTGGMINTSNEPKYVAVSMKFNGKEWYRVGFRLKGNSSLSSIWRAGIFKLPLRLKMDEFEDQYPEIQDQRFYGFKELSLSPAFKDNSLIREKVTADIFRMAGIPAAQTAFYKMYIDFGDGLKYCGVYTMLETIEDEMLKAQFGEEKGNAYKPESTFQTFNQAQFEKKNNEEAADWSDVKAAITALNDPIRTTNAAQWRTNFEKTFNVDHFIKWLAVNTTLVNWDTYGAMAHNHYLYNHSTKKLTWIPWDNNEALTSNARVQLSLAGVTSGWPLIRYIANDAVYYAKYKSYVKEFNNNIFTTVKMNELFDRNTALIAPYVNGTEKEQVPYSNLTSLSNFIAALPILKQHVISRNQVVSAFVK
jgi:hypothetical protein